MNFCVLIPRRLAAAAIVRLVAAGIRTEVGEGVAEAMSYNCSSLNGSSNAEHEKHLPRTYSIPGFAPVTPPDHHILY